MFYPKSTFVCPYEAFSSSECARSEGYCCNDPERNYCCSSHDQSQPVTKLWYFWFGLALGGVVLCLLISVLAHRHMKQRKLRKLRKSAANQLYVRTLSAAMTSRNIVNPIDSRSNPQERPAHLNSSHDDGEVERSANQQTSAPYDEAKPPSYHDQLLLQKSQLEEQIRAINLQLEGGDFPDNNNGSGMVCLVDEADSNEPPPYTALYKI